jgi:hypothetical protein
VYALLKSGNCFEPMASSRKKPSDEAQPYKAFMLPNASPNILSWDEPVPSNLPRKLVSRPLLPHMLTGSSRSHLALSQVWLGDRMHFRVTEFKQALRNEDFDSLIFTDDELGGSRMELTVRLSSVYREKMIWHKLTRHAAASGATNVLDAGSFRALREVLEPLCLYAGSHVAFKRTLVAALNHLIFDDGRLILVEPRVEGPFMDPALTSPQAAYSQPQRAPFERSERPAPAERLGASQPHPAAEQHGTATGRSAVHASAAASPAASPIKMQTKKQEWDRWHQCTSQEADGAPKRCPPGFAAEATPVEHALSFAQLLKHTRR